MRYATKDIKQNIDKLWYEGAFVNGLNDIKSVWN